MNNEKDKNLNALEPQEETAAPQQQEEAREETAAPQQEATEEKATKKQDSGKKKSGKKKGKNFLQYIKKIITQYYCGVHQEVDTAQLK